MLQDPSLIESESCKMIEQSLEQSSEQYRQSEDAIDARRELRELDFELLRLLERRAALTEGLGKEQMMLLFDSELEREEQVRVADMAEDPFIKQAVRETLSQVMAVTRKRMISRLSKMSADADETGAVLGETEEELQKFTPVEELPFKNIRVVYQGVEGAYSHQATMKFFGRSVDCFSEPSFESAVKAVQKGRADYAVLPIENTTGGAIGDVLDLTMKYPCYTVGEIDLPIQHVLLGLADAKLSDITTVYSHPQGLMQCTNYLEEHKDWARVPFSNTAASAKNVVADGDIHHAAIASDLCGEIYGLKILESGISNNKTNVTRFIVVTKEKIYRKGAGKIRICFECRHATGTLYRLLSNFTFNEINMTKIESRPLPGRNFEYRFFVDLEGSLEDANVRNAIWGIRHEATCCRVLGNF